MANFSNRVSNNTNRKKLKIVEQSDTELIVDVERADDNVVNVGTKITAETFNAFDERILSAESNSTSAKTAAEAAEASAEKAQSIAGQAKVIAEEVQKDVSEIAEDMLTLQGEMSELETRVDNSVNTITINGEVVHNLAFDSDPQTQLNSKASSSALESETTARRNKDDELQKDISDIENNNTIISNIGGGFAGGLNSDAYGTSIALGLEAKTSYEQSTTDTQGATEVKRIGTGNVAIGEYAKAFSSTNGKSVAIGSKASAGTNGVSAYGDSAVAVGESATAGTKSVAVGKSANAVQDAIAIGAEAKASASSSIQLGKGTNTKTKSLQIFDDNIYDANTHTLSVQNITFNGVDLSTKLDDLSSDVSNMVNYYTKTEVDGLINSVNSALNNKASLAELNSKILFGDINISSSSWNALSDNTYYKYHTTIELAGLYDDNYIVELINDNPNLFVKYGFVIADITYDNLTIYSTEEVTEDVVLKLQVTKAQQGQIQWVGV